MREPAEKPAAFGRPYYILIVVNALASISFYVVNPVLTKYLTGSGMALTLASTIAGLFSLTALTIRPFTGVIADRISQRRILYVTIPLLAASVIGYSLTTSTVLVVLFRILNGVAFCFNGTTLTAYASRFIPRQRMGEGIGYLGLGNVAASAVGPTIGVAVGDALGYRASFLAAGLISLLALGLLLLVQDGPCREDERPSVDRSGKNLCLTDIIALQIIPIAFLNGLFSYSNGTVTNFLVLIAEENGVAGCSLYFTVLAACMLVLRPMAGRLNDRFGLRFLLIPAFLVTCVGVLLIANAQSLWMVLLAAPLMAFGQGGGQPAIQAQCIREVGPERRGVATSTYYIFADLFQGAGPIVGGLAVEAAGTCRAAFYAAAGILLAGLACFFLLCAWRKKKGLPAY